MRNDTGCDSESEINNQCTGGSNFAVNGNGAGIGFIAGGDGGLSALEYDPGMGLTTMTESIAPQDALIRIDGLDVTSNVRASMPEGRDTPDASASAEVLARQVRALGMSPEVKR